MSEGAHARSPLAPRWGDAGSGTQVGCFQAWKSFSSRASALLGRTEAREPGSVRQGPGRGMRGASGHTFQEALFSGSCKRSSLPWGRGFLPGSIPPSRERTWQLSNWPKEPGADINSGEGRQAMFRLVRLAGSTLAEPGSPCWLAIVRRLGATPSLRPYCPPWHRGAPSKPGKELPSTQASPSLGQAITPDLWPQLFPAPETKLGRAKL